MARDNDSIVAELTEAKIEIGNLKVRLVALEAACQSLAQNYNSHCLILHKHKEPSFQPQQ